MKAVAFFASCIASLLWVDVAASEAIFLKCSGRQVDQHGVSSPVSLYYKIDPAKNEVDGYDAERSRYVGNMCSLAHWHCSLEANLFLFGSFIKTEANGINSAASDYYSIDRESGEFHSRVVMSDAVPSLGQYNETVFSTIMGTCSKTADMTGRSIDRAF